MFLHWPISASGLRIGESRVQTRDLNKKIASGVGWMLGLKLADRLIRLTSTVILARLLLPSDFGLIAMAMSVVAVVELIRALGFETALIQNQSAVRQDYDTAWTLNIVFSLVVAVTLVLVSDAAQSYFAEPRIQPILLVLAASEFIFGFQNIGIVAFRKDLTFHKEFWFIFSRRVFTFCVTISVAVIMRNYWALLVGIVAGNVFSVCASYLVQPYRPRISFESTRALMNFSKWLLANQLLNVLNTRSLHFILGRFESSRSVGLFTVSYEIAALPTTSLISPINRALFPGYAKMSHDLALLRAGVLNVLALIFFIGIPAGIGVSLTAEYLVPVVLGERWADAVPLIEILAVSGALIAARANFSTALIAVGKPKFITFVSALHALLLVPTLFLAIPSYGIVGAAFAYLCVEALLLSIRYGVLMKTLQIQASSLVVRLWRPVTSTAVMALVLQVGIKEFVEQTEISDAVGLGLTVFSGAAVYLATAFFLWTVSGRPSGPEREIISRMRVIATPKASETDQGA